MTKKIITFMMVLLCGLSIASCKKEKKVESISIIQETISSDITTENAETEILNISLDVKYNNGDKEVCKIKKEMLSDSDYQKLKTVGNHQLTITYSGCSTKLTLEVKAAASNKYRVTVQYPNGTPASGVTVQWCSQTNCFLPVAVNSEGYAEIALEDGTYYVHIDNIPSGYTYNPNAHTTTIDNKHLTIVLDPSLPLTTGDGTTANPYVVSLGAYELTFNGEGKNEGKYFSFTASKTGTVNLFSTATTLLALNEIDPYLGYIGETSDLPNFSLGSADVSGNDNKNINFNYSFNVEAGKTYYFLVFVSSATTYPATFNIYLK